MNRGILALLVCCLAFEAQAKPEAIDPASARLVVNAQALGVGGYRIWRQTDNPNQYFEVLLATSGGFPRIELVYTELYGSMYWTASVHEVLERVKKGFLFVKGKDIREIRTTAFRNQLGRGQASVFRLADKSCVGFHQFAGDATYGTGKGSLFGYYCAAIGDDISDDMIAVITRQYGVSGADAPPKPDETSLAVLAVLAELGRGAAAAPSPPKRTAPFVLSWEGEADRLSGTVTFTQEGGYGEITVSVPEWSATCTGRWRFETGKYGTDDLPKGTWHLGCSNGLSATGSYVSPALGRGTGSGQDTRGRAVKVTFGQ